MSGCSKTGSEVVKKNPDSVALTAEINAVKLSKVSSNISTALTTENCTIRQYAAKKVKSERFFCKIEGVNQLLLYAKPNQNSIAWMDSKEQVYVFNLHDVNTQLVVNGRVKVNNSSWEFVPQNNRFLIGPKRVEVVLDQSTH